MRRGEWRTCPRGDVIFPGLTVRENVMLGASNRSVVCRSGRSAAEADAMFDLFPDIRPFVDKRSVGRCRVANCRWWHSRAD